MKTRPAAIINEQERLSSLIIMGARGYEFLEFETLDHDQHRLPESAQFRHAVRPGRR